MDREKLEAWLRSNIK